MSPLARIDELLGRRVSMRALALLRIPVGLIVLRHLQPFLDDARAGHIYRDAFYEPYAAWYPELPRNAYIALLWLGAVAAVTMTIGLFTRVSCAVVFGVVTYNVFLSTTHLHNNRAYLVIVLAVLAVAPCGRELSIDAWHRVSTLAEPAPGWPLWLLRFEASIVYGASGVSKLLDPDWFGGTVMWQRVVRQQAELPDWAVSFLTDRTFHSYTSKVIVATECFVALGLWVRSTRYAAVWFAVLFHISIELYASVQIFSYLAIAALVIWAVPSTRDRVLRIDPENVAHRRFARAVRWFDWLARFRIESAPGRTMQVVDRDGRVLEGAAAVEFALSRLPVTAWFALAFVGARRLQDRVDLRQVRVRQ